MDKSLQIAELLIKLSPEAVASTAAGGLGGGLLALGFSSLNASTSAVSFGAGAFAMGGGSTAITLKGGVAVAIGAGVSATSVGGIAIAIAPFAAIGMGVGALIGLLTYFVCRYGSTNSEKDKKDSMS